MRYSTTLILALAVLLVAVGIYIFRDRLTGEPTEPAKPAEALNLVQEVSLADITGATLQENTDGEMKTKIAFVRTDGKWRLTERGIAALREHPDGLDQSDLMQYPEYAAHVRATAHHSSGMDPRENSYDQGYQARRDGLPLTANPYAFDSVDHQSWENGWMEAADEEPKR